MIERELVNILNNLPKIYDGKYTKSLLVFEPIIITSYGREQKIYCLSTYKDNLFINEAVEYGELSDDDKNKIIDIIINSDEHNKWLLNKLENGGLDDDQYHNILMTYTYMEDMYIGYDIFEDSNDTFWSVNGFDISLDMKSDYFIINGNISRFDDKDTLYNVLMYLNKNIEMVINRNNYA